MLRSLSRTAAALRPAAVARHLSSSSDAVGFVVPYDVKPSPLGGVGIFARELIPTGTLVWKTAPNVNCKGITQAEVRSHLASLATDEEKYYFASHIWVGDGLAWYPLEGDQVDLWNHSNDANIADGSFDGIACKDIQAGDEMLCDYSSFEYPQWLMDVYHEYDVPYDYINIKEVTK
jgi:hypothetical protein